MKITLDLTKTQYEQLVTYALWAEENGVYYGNRAQFWKRHEKIKEQLCKKVSHYTGLEVAE